MKNPGTSTHALARHAGLSVALLIAMVALAADANVNAGKSSLVATFKQEGVPVDTTFKKFSGSIVYNAANPAGSTAALDVDMGSFDMGDAAYNAEVRKKSWFDTAKFPTSTFRSTAIKAGAAGQFTASGNLTVKGQVLAISIPITAKTAAGITTYSGSYDLSRKAFGIGDAIWEDAVDDKVVVKFSLVTAAK
jgi:polyisoprenoid-binding protein YceI